MTTCVVTDEQLGVYARREHDLFRRLRDGTLPVDGVLRGLQGLIEGNFDAVPQPSGRIIDCDAQPYLPTGWSIRPEDQIKSRVRGEIEFDPAKVVFHLTEEQKTGTLVGTKLKEWLESKLVLNACVPDMLLANTNLIPESWKKNEVGKPLYIHFWGTIYRGHDGGLYVRYLSWRDGQWRWGYNCLAGDFDAEGPAAILAS